MDNKQYILPLVSTVVFIIYVTLDGVYNDQLWNFSTDFTENMQSDSFLGEFELFLFFSTVVYVPPIVCVFAYLLADNKLNILFYFVVSITSVTANEMLKLLYHQARPYMIESTITPKQCDADYGKPSGHAMNSVVTVVLMPFLVFPQLLQLKQNRQQRESNIQFDQKEKTGYTIDSLEPLKQSEHEQIKNELRNIKQSKRVIAIKYFILTLLGISLFMTGLSRVYLGVHTVGQVILGWVYGGYLIIIYLTIIQKPLRNLCLQVFRAFKHNSDEYKLAVPISIVLFILLTIILVMLLEFNIHYFVTDSEMQTWILAIEKCKDEPIGTLSVKSPSILYNGCFVASFFAAFIPGLLIGAFTVKGTYQEGYFYQNYSRMTGSQQFQRIAYFFIMFTVLIGFAFIDTNDVFIQGFLQVLPVAFIGGFLFSAGYTYMCSKTNIQIKGELFYQLGAQDESPLSHQVLFIQELTAIKP